MSVYYVGLNKNIDIVKHSSSGGAFTAFCESWFCCHDNAVVCGSVMSDGLQPVHVFANSLDECRPMRGSKYIASKLNGSIEKAGEYLRNGTFVLFSGTPCQIFALNTYLDKQEINKDNLFTIDVICHGVAEEIFFRDYILHLEKKYHGKAIRCRFRAKRRAGSIQDMQVVFDNGKVYNASSTKYDWFYSVYNKNINLRRGCYSCKLASENRISDVSLGDAWGNDNFFGKSLIMFNTRKSEELLNQIEKYMELTVIDKNMINQPALLSSANKPKEYDDFWEIYHKKGYLAAQKYFGNNTLRCKIMDKIVYILNEIGLKNLIKNVKRRLIA